MNDHPRRYCLALDIEDDAQLIDAYRKHQRPQGENGARWRLMENIFRLNEHED